VTLEHVLRALFRDELRKVAALPTVTDVSVGEVWRTCDRPARGVPQDRHRKDEERGQKSNAAPYLP